VGSLAAENEVVAASVPFCALGWIVPLPITSVFINPTPLCPFLAVTALCFIPISFPRIYPQRGFPLALAHTTVPAHFPVACFAHCITYSGIFDYLPRRCRVSLNLSHSVEYLHRLNQIK
jgi:hypothetical protein